MEIDDKIYLLYDIVEEVKPGVALACTNQGIYADLDIYHNNEIVHSYTKVIKYETTGRHILICGNGQSYFEMQDIINIDSLERMSDKLKEKGTMRILGNYYKYGKVYICSVHTDAGDRQLIFNEKLDILNSEFRQIHNVMCFGNICSFITNISKESKLLGFRADKVLMSRKTGKVLYTRKVTVGLIDGEVVCSIEHVLKVLALAIILGGAFVFKMIRDSG